MDDESLDKDEMLESASNFEAAYRSHFKAIYTFLFWHTRNTQLSEDLTSSTFERAWASRKSFHGDSEQAWFYRIARNILTDHWRKKKELLVEDSDDLYEDVQPSMEDSLERALRLQSLQKALDQLPKDMHAVVSLRFIEGQTCKQVASALNLSESNVRVIQYRALKKLRQYLK